MASHAPDISACKNLLRLSIDNTDVAELDLSTCPQLQILNISETRIPAVDLSKLPNLTQFYCTHTSATNTDIKLESLDVTHNPSLMYLFCSGNRIKELDLTKNTYLTDIYADHNMLTSLDLSNNKQLFNVYISKNYMDFNTLPIDNLGIWGNYDYEQYPLPVGRSQQVGVGIDLASRVCRLDADGNEITPTTSPYTPARKTTRPMYMPSTHPNTPMIRVWLHSSRLSPTRATSSMPTPLLRLIRSNRACLP